MIPLVYWSLSFLSGAALGLALPGYWEPAFLFGSFLVAGPLLLSLLRFDLGQYRFHLAAVLLLFLGGMRSLGIERAFDYRCSLFPAPIEGTFRGYIAEDPEVLFERVEGGHETGREGGVYAPYVERARAVIVLDEMNGRVIPAVRVRCSFILPRDGGAPVLSYGDGIRVRGTLSPPPVALNPG